MVTAHDADSASSRQLVSHYLLLARRPLTMLFVIGCAISLLASGRFTARLIVDAAVSFAFVPAAQMIALATVHRVRHSAMPPPRTIDEYFRTNLPWLWWILAIAVFAMFVPAPKRGDLGPMLLTVPVPIVLGVVTDWRFFRRALGETPGRAAANVAGIRAISWSLAMIYFFGPGSSTRTFLYIFNETFQMVGQAVQAL
jgi:hypothetical protein